MQRCDFTIAGSNNTTHAPYKMVILAFVRFALLHGHVEST